MDRAREKRNVRRRSALIAALVVAPAMANTSCGASGPAKAPHASASASSPAHVDCSSTPTTNVTGVAGTIVAVRIVGSRRLAPQTLCNLLRTKAGLPFDSATIAADLHALWDTHMIDDANAQRSDAARGVVVTFAVRERPIVDHVQIEGNPGVPANVIKAQMPVKVGAPFDLADLKDTTTRLRVAYMDEGYRSVTIQPNVAATRADHVEVRLTIERGPRAIISSLDFDGLKSMTASAARVLFDVQGGTVGVPGGIYRDQDASIGVRRLRDALDAQGLLDVHVDMPTLTLSADGTALSLRVAVREGPAFSFGTVEFRGALVADEKTYLKIFAHKPGDPFTRSAVNEGIDRVRAFHQTKGKASTDVALDEELDHDKARANLKVTVLP